MKPIAFNQRNGVRYPLVRVADADDISAVALALEAGGVTCDVIGEFLGDWAQDQAAAHRWVTVDPTVATEG